MPGLRERVTAMTTNDRKPTDNETDSIDKSAAWLTGGLTAFAGVLAAVGGLTGGIARMFRNSSFSWIMLAVCSVILSVALAAVSRIARKSSVAGLVLIISSLTFAVGTATAISLMVATSSQEDRPALTAQLVRSETGGWVLKAKASTSGLKSQERMQLFVYAQPKSTPTPSPKPQTRITATPTGVAPTSTGTSTAGVEPPRPRPAPKPTRPLLLGDRLLFADAGPNIEGVATQEVEIPLPVDKNYTALVVTANLGDQPRDCEGGEIQVEGAAGASVPPVIPDRGGSVACIVLAAPPNLTPALTAAVRIPP